MKNLSVDIETFSSIDLTKSGVYRYAEAPDFEVILLGYSVDGGDVIVLDLASGDVLPVEIREALLDDTVIKWAFNAQFERVCLSRYLGTWLKPDAWKCTMIWSAYMGLPLSLVGVGAVLGIKKQKLVEGKELIRYFSKPCKPTKANGGAPEICPLMRQINGRRLRHTMPEMWRLNLQFSGGSRTSQCLIMNGKITILIRR